MAIQLIKDNDANGPSPTVQILLEISLSFMNIATSIKSQKFVNLFSTAPYLYQSWSISWVPFIFI